VIGQLITNDGEQLGRPNSPWHLASSLDGKLIELVKTMHVMLLRSLAGRVEGRTSPCPWGRVLPFG